MQRFNDRVTEDTGTLVRWVVNPTVTVYDSGTMNFSVLFSDDGITPLANPFTGDINGMVFFYAADGLYDVVYSGGTPAVSYTIGAVQLDDTLGLTPSSGGITSLNGLTIATQGLSTGLSGSDFNIASYGSGHTFNLPIAGTSRTGKLQASDFITFNAKLASINALTVTAQFLALGTTGTSPNIVSATNTHTINLPVASLTNTGVLSNSDWQLFNGKQDSLSGSSSLQYYRGDGVFSTLNTSVVPEVTNLYYTDARARLALSATAPITYNNASGVIAANAATGAQNGYLTSTDWNTFNNKLGTLNTLTTATQTFSTDGGSGTDFSIASAGSTHVFKLPSASTSNRGLVTTGPQTINGPKTFASEVYVQKYVELTSISDVTNPAAAQGRLYLRYNGSKYELVIIFPSGARQVIATEP